MRKLLVALLRFVCLLLLLASLVTIGFAATPKYDYQAQHCVLVEQSAPITQSIPDLAPAELKTAFVSTLGRLAATESSQCHIYANAPPIADNQAETSPSALQIADVTASSFGQNVQLLAAKEIPRFPKTAQEMEDFLKVPGKKIPDGPTTPGRNKTVFQPNPDTKITVESHPYDTTAPDWHKDLHYHVDTPGLPPHSRFVPGDPIPGY